MEQSLVLGRQSLFEGHEFLVGLFPQQPSRLDGPDVIAQPLERAAEAVQLDKGGGDKRENTLKQSVSIRENKQLYTCMYGLRFKHMFIFKIHEFSQ